MRWRASLAEGSWQAPTYPGVSEGAVRQWLKGGRDASSAVIKLLIYPSGGSYDHELPIHCPPPGAHKTLHQRIKDAYQATFIGRDGQMHPDKQASYVRALALDLVPPTLQRAAVDHLVRLIQENDDHLGTGFLSTPFLCHVLSENGQLEVAYALLKQDTIPSWLYEVKKGATTIWEDWDGIGEDGIPHGSLNHYSKGAVGSWLYQVVAGIEPGTPGYKHTGCVSRETAFKAVSATSGYTISPGT